MALDRAAESRGVLPIARTPISPMSIRLTQRHKNMLEALRRLYGFQSHSGVVRHLLEEAHHQLITEAEDQDDRENEGNGSEDKPVS